MKQVLVGGQYGDEGKGKISSYLAIKDAPEIVARGGVGPNAGHKVLYEGKWYSLRMLPSGFVNPNSKVMIGAGVSVDPEVFMKEIEMTNTDGRVFVDKRCTTITQKHKEEDAAAALSKKIGTTKTGCGPSVTSRARRDAVLMQDVPEMQKYVVDVADAVHKAKDVFVEGSQGFMLSCLYGTYPFVTSKDVSASTIAADVGLGPTSIEQVIMVIKAYTTRVGNGPFPSEIEVEESVKLNFQEYGTVTGRPRRTSPELHWEDLNFAAQVNSATQIAVTKVDIRFPGNEGKTKYDELTAEARMFIDQVEAKLGVPVTLIGTGPDAKHIIDRRDKML
ncbi:adenylosuccinate synthetase [Candidatus Micrarchaeota archaeon]|nr:adenylosuccinate synthetase [Candidatus Micrarchaeota archaeon]MBD3418379.1 adenylosuccinate synthetase [Candidatus Micrarchaeota archaeon]